MIRQYQGTFIRWFLGVGLLGLAFHLVVNGYHRLDIAYFSGGLLCFVLGIVALWKTIFHVATRPFTLFIDSIFFPGGKLPKPVLNLKLPAYYLNESRFEEALAEYQKVLKYHPDAVEAYEKAIWLNLDIFDDPDEARKLLRRARRRGLVLDERILRRTSELDVFPQRETR